MVRVLAVIAATLACGHAHQLVTVEASGTSATLSAFECGRRALGPWRARVGRGGVSAAKREGDGATPAGTFALGPTIYGLEADPGVHLRYHRLVCGDWWDEDPGSPSYNRFRHVRCGTAPPFGGGSEALWREPVAGHAFAVVEYNAAPVVPGRGSAIFLHPDLGHPTAGCVSLPEPQLLRLLRWLRPGARIHIGIS